MDDWVPDKRFALSRTTYHAAALHIPEARLTNADERYYPRGRDLGRITLPADLTKYAS